MATASQKKTAKLQAEVDPSLVDRTRVYCAANRIKLPALLTEAVEQYLKRHSDRMPVMPAR